MTRKKLDPKQRERRKQVAIGTLITCIALAMVGGSLHVMKLGSMRMDEMRAKASYDVKDMHEHIRAAGEEIHLQAAHEAGKQAGLAYTQAQVEQLLNKAQWQKLASMRTIPAGEFIMGTNNPRANTQNKPEHRVMLPSFQIDTYAVTQAEYARFVLAHHYRPPLNWKHGEIPQGMAMHPVTMVSWYNARDYCDWEGKRLPTEAEWEKAARGDAGQRWPWGAKMNVNALNVYYHVGHTTPVDAYPQGASPYGVLDMSGNVQEWTATEFAPYPGADSADQVFHPKKLDASYRAGSEEKERLVYYVMRGGSWKSDPFSAATYHRNYSLPNYASDFFGFRCARDMKE